MDKTSLVSLENALAAAEDATDVAAARTARAEAQADMAEFDESIPINSLGDSSQTESKAEQEVVALMEQVINTFCFCLIRLMAFAQQNENCFSHICSIQ